MTVNTSNVLFCSLYSSWCFKKTTIKTYYGAFLKKLVICCWSFFPGPILDEIEILQQETADSDERFANVNNNKRLKENWRVPFFTSSGVVLVVIRLSIGSQEGVTRHPSSAFSVGWLKSRIQFFSVRPPKITKNRELVGIWKKKSGMRFSKMKKIGKSRPVGKSGTHGRPPSGSRGRIWPVLNHHFQSVF